MHFSDDMDNTQLLFGFGKGLFGILFEAKDEGVHSGDGETIRYSLHTSLDCYGHIHTGYST